MPKIKPGQIWICKRSLSFGINSSDVLVKVLSATPNFVYTIRKTDFGFTDLPPETYKTNVFLDAFLLLK